MGGIQTILMLCVSAALMKAGKGHWYLNCSGSCSQRMTRYIYSTFPARGSKCSKRFRDPLVQWTGKLPTKCLTDSISCSAENFNSFPRTTRKVSIKSNSFFSSSDLYSLKKHYCPCGLCFLIAFVKTMKKQIYRWKLKLTLYH